MQSALETRASLKAQHHSATMSTRYSFFLKDVENGTYLFVLRRAQEFFVESLSLSLHFPQ